MSNQNTEVNCWECRFFSISWDKSRRYQCNKLGFKSSILPSIEVLNADGRPCLSHEPKERNQKK